MKILCKKHNAAVLGGGEKSELLHHQVGISPGSCSADAGEGRAAPPAVPTEHGEAWRDRCGALRGCGGVGGGPAYRGGGTPPIGGDGGGP